jgi:translation initiation factor 2 subunit 1
LAEAKKPLKKPAAPEAKPQPQQPPAAQAKPVPAPQARPQPQLSKPEPQPSKPQPAPQLKPQPQPAKSEPQPVKQQPAQPQPSKPEPQQAPRPADARVPRLEEWPEPGKLVVCRVKAVKAYGAFVDLVEYGKEGFVHVSQIASGWVKNIRAHVSENQVRVGQVINIDRTKNVIDLSLRKVGPSQEREKLSEWKRAKRADKLFERAANRLKADFTKSYLEIVPKLKEKHGDLYSAFEAGAAEGEKAFAGIPAAWAPALAEVSKASITIPEVTVKGRLKFKFFTPDGIERVKALAKQVESAGASVHYISAPEYSVSVTAKDYVEAERILKKAVAVVEAAVKGAGESSFERTDKK